MVWPHTFAPGSESPQSWLALGLRGGRDVDDKTPFLPLRLLWSKDQDSFGKTVMSQAPHSRLLTDVSPHPHPHPHPHPRPPLLLRPVSLREPRMETRAQLSVELSPCPLPSLYRSAPPFSLICCGSVAHLLLPESCKRDVLILDNSWLDHLVSM